MNDQERTTAVSPALNLADASAISDEHKNPALWGDYEEAALLEQLRQTGEADAETRAALQAGLIIEDDPVRLWFLLSCLEHIPARTVATELVFEALARLVSSTSPVIRLSAYRWLAGLYRIDLRFENRAKLKLRDCLATENGVMQQRLEHFLSTC